MNYRNTKERIISIFEEIITSKEVKFNDLEKKVFKFVCFFGCLIIKLMLEVYDRKLMENRDKKKYRHKGLRETSVNTIMGEIKYKRVMYEVQEEGITKRENKEFNPKMKIKTELKLHVMYEGWKKEDPRHSLINKQYIAGIMKPKEIARLRHARLFSQYDESKIKLRVTNGDGAKWTKGTTAKGGIYQKNQFHISEMRYSF